MKPIILRPDQERMANEAMAHLERGVNVALQAQTGSGKTVTAAAIIRTVVDVGWSVVFLVHRRELLHQSVRALAAVGIDPAIVDTNHDPDPMAPVHVCSIDTLKARKGRLAIWLQTIRLVVIDEAHHAVAPGWRSLLEAMPNARRLGLTATPFRGDGKPLGDLFDEAVRGPSVAELTAAGFLCPAEVWAPVMNLDLSGVKISRGDYVQSDLDRVMDNDAITRMAMDQYSARMPGKPAIAFCVSVDHAKHVADAFARLGGWNAVSVDGSMSTEERDAAIRGLADGRIQVLTSCMIVSEGTDIPVVAGAIKLRPTKSMLLYRQQVGRVLRPSAGKAHACVIDLADNVKLHGMPDADLDWSLRHGLIPTARPTIRCPACHRRFAAGPKCPTCGRQFRSYAAPTMMRRIDQMDDSALRLIPLADLERAARSELDLIRIAKARCYASGWLYHAKQRLAARLAKQYEQRRYG